MQDARPLPAYLLARYNGWKATRYAADQSWFHQLARDGQHPRVMVISCCDSRVHVTSIFEADPGEFFIHRNIANLVPPYSPDGAERGTAAAIEYAVTALHVAHLLIVGHSNCGGVKATLDICAGDKPELSEPLSFVGQWLGPLRAHADRIIETTAPEDRQCAMERQTVVASLENLMTYPFVQKAVAAGDLTLHGLRVDIGSGLLEVYDPEHAGFRPV